MTHSMRLIVVSIASLLFACSSTQKKPEAKPESTAPVAVAQKPAEPVAAEKPVKPAKPANQLLCEQGSDQRTVVIESKSATACDVHYSKFGNSEKVASALHTPSFCAEVKEKIRANLEAGQFSCK